MATADRVEGHRTRGSVAPHGTVLQPGHLHDEAGAGGEAVSLADAGGRGDADSPRAPPVDDLSTRTKRALDWLFRSHATGKITVVQFPNLPLGVFLVASVLRAALHPTGAWHGVLAVTATAGLVSWAIDEVARGVNPWRRGLGLGALVWQVVGLLSR